MENPVILALDDEPGVLSAVVRDLRRQYGSDYRILRATSGAQALGALRELKLRNEPLALMVVDQRMPEMSGIEFLKAAIELFPDSRRVLLTAYADTEAAIRAINEVALDHYLMKPWDPPEEHLYPVLNELLDDWRAAYRTPFEGIRVVGDRWSLKSHEIKNFLARNQVPYQWLDIENQGEAQLVLEQVPEDERQLPLLVFPDGSTLTNPNLTALAEKIGMRTHAELPFYDLIIVGAGPAGLAAAVYGASEGLRTMVIEREVAGGQAGSSSRIENYLGFPSGLSGSDLTRRAVAQAQRLGAEILTAQEVCAVEIEGPYRIVTLNDGSKVSCHTLLIATGVSYRKIDAPGIERLHGAGVYYGGAIAEAVSTRGEDIFIVGGANSAGQAARYFSKYARKVTMLVRGESLAQGMSQYLVDQIEATPNIEVWLRTNVVEAHGEHRLEAISIEHSDSGEIEKVPATSLFIFIGAQPRTDWIADLVMRDQGKFILTGPDLIKDGKPPAGWPLDRAPFLLETNVPGIFVAGDVRHRSMKRIASAVGEGAMAVHFVHQYLSTLGPT